MLNGLHQLWNSLPAVGDSLWKYSPADQSDLSARKREAVQLLAGALWHLELVAALGPVDQNSLKTLHAGPNRWEPWRNNPPALSTSSTHEALVVTHQLGDLSDTDTRVLMQSMLILDAAVRLDGARHILLTAGSRTSDALAQRDIIEQWLDSKGCFKPSTSALQRNVAKVVCFRDSYMHGEISTQKKQPCQKAFRKGPLMDESLASILAACEEVWKELVCLAR